jgi:hypothetical protein
MLLTDELEVKSCLRVSNKNVVSSLGVCIDKVEGVIAFFYKVIKHEILYETEFIVLACIL